MNKSIRTKYLLTGLLICLISLLLVSIASYYVAYSITKEQVNRWAQATATQKATELDIWFRKYAQILEDLGAEIENKEEYLDTVQLIDTLKEKTAKHKSEAVGFYVLLANNKLLSPEPNYTPPPDFDFRTRDWYVKAVTGKLEFYSIPYIDTYSKKMVVTISRAMKKDNKIIGVVCVDFYVTNMMDLVKGYNFGEGSYAFLLDQKGNILTHPYKEFSPNETTMLKNIDAIKNVNYLKLQESLKSSRVVEINDYDGESRVFITSKISSCNWVMGIALPKSLFQKPLNSLFYGYAIALLLSLIVCIGIMFKLVNGMTTPIKLLNDSVKRFSAEDMAVRVAVTTGDEIGELGQNFNQMAETIQEYSQSLEHKVVERTRELQEKNDNIMESIDYAERLQRAILPPLPQRLGITADKCFVIWKPKDVVGGDMYWCRGDERFVLVAVVDCTGHGVPGALMTMALGSILDGLPRELEGVNPSDLLYKIHNRLKETLSQDHKNSLANDGADVALCLIDKMDRKFMYAGAKLSLFMEKDGEITEYKGTKHSVGYSLRKEVVYEDSLIEWIDGSVVYLTTDGLLDQNGEEGKGGIGRTGFKNLLKSIAGRSFREQEQVLEQVISDRLKNVEQRDDITVVGFEIG